MFICHTQTEVFWTSLSYIFSLHLPLDDVLMASLGGILTAGAEQLSQLRYHTDKVLSQAENELLTEVNAETCDK